MNWPLWYRRIGMRYLARYDRVELIALLDSAHQAIGWREYLMCHLARAMTVEDIFTLVHSKNLWGVLETKSGAGSTLAETSAIRAQLSDWFRRFGITSVLDIPCGDFNWMRQVDLTGVHYIGADIVAELVSTCTAQYAAPLREFRCLDVLTDALPRMDAVLCRDCLVHLPTPDVLRALANIQASGARYLLATTFPSLVTNENVAPGFWRPLNLELLPFSLPPPIALLREGNPDPRYADKSLALWKVADLPPP